MGEARIGFTTDRTAALLEVGDILDIGVMILDQSLSEYRSQLGDANVVLLDPERDGVVQITEFLDGQNDVSALHVITHGSADGVTLGNARLGASTLDGYADQLAEWSEALTSDADILLYGCSVGADQAFLAGLAGVTGADVAASTDPTGNGDWDLEAAVGAIEAAPFALAYGGILDATLSGEPDFVEQGPSTILPDLDELLGSLPPEVIGGGEGQGPTDTDSTPTAFGIDFADIPVAAGQSAPIRFTFFWRESRRWEGRDFEIDVVR